MLVLAAMDEPSSPPWTLYLSMIAYQSCRAFLEYDTIEGNVRQFRAPPNQQYRLRVPKLGSCFGGFTCSSPSYLAPAHYKLFRDFSARFAPLIDPVNGETRAAADRLKWDALIEGSQQILSESQCANGLVPNWWVPSQGANLYAHEKTATGAVAGEARGAVVGPYGSSGTPTCGRRCFSRSSRRRCPAAPRGRSCASGPRRRGCTGTTGA